MIVEEDEIGLTGSVIPPPRLHRTDVAPRPTRTQPLEIAQGYVNLVIFALLLLSVFAFVQQVTLAPPLRSLTFAIEQQQQVPTQRPTFPKSNLLLAEQLDTLQCVPEVCKTAKDFTMSPNFTLLASYPGSGNTWARTIVEGGSRIWTGSVYLDKSLAHSGFMGETLSTFETNTSLVSTIKTHYPYYTHPIDVKTTGVILVMRSPFDAMLAEFTRVHGKGASHRSKASQQILSARFPNAFAKSYLRWETYVKFWFPPHVRTKAQMQTEHGITSYHYDIQISGGRQVPVLLLFYEDFVRNSPQTSLRMFMFLKQQLGEAMPTNAIEAVACAFTDGQQDQTKEKREHAANEYNIYLDEESELVKRNLVYRACEAWKPYWFEDVWGECMQPDPQAQRIQQDVNNNRLGQVVEYCNNGGKLMEHTRRPTIRRTKRPTTATPSNNDDDDFPVRPESVFDKGDDNL